MIRDDKVVIESSVSLVWLADQVVSNLTDTQVLEFILLLDEAVQSCDFTKELLNKLSETFDGECAGE